MSSTYSSYSLIIYVAYSCVSSNMGIPVAHPKNGYLSLTSDNFSYKENCFTCYMASLSISKYVHSYMCNIFPVYKLMKQCTPLSFDSFSAMDGMIILFVPLLVPIQTKSYDPNKILYLLKIMIWFSFKYHGWAHCFLIFHLWLKIH